MKEEREGVERSSEIISTLAVSFGVREYQEMEAERYMENCRKYGMACDPNVVITLRTGWAVLQPTKAFGQGSMLPLMDILDENTTVEKVVLRGVGMIRQKRSAGNGNSNARVLNHILQRNNTIKHLDLTDTGMDGEGLKEICEGLTKNTSVRYLNISRNHFHYSNVGYLQHVLACNHNLAEVDLRRNLLGWAAISEIRSNERTQKHVKIHSEGNFLFEEFLNSSSHAFGFLLTVIGSIVLMKEASQEGKSQTHFWSCLIFSLSLLILYLASALYHSFFLLPSVAAILQIVDHCAIYFLIAGTYTPCALIAFHYSARATAVVVCEWIFAFAGILFSMYSEIGSFRRTLAELVIYLSMGYLVVFMGTDILRAALDEYREVHTF